MTRKLNLGAGSDFESEIRRLKRRIGRIQGLATGETRIVKIEIGRVAVKKHWRAAHVRHVIVPTHGNTTRRANRKKGRA